MNKIIENLNWRYATKKFDKNKRVSKDDLDTIIEAFRLTPSSFWLQPWKLIIVKNQELKDKLVEHTWGQAQVSDCSELLVFSKKNNFWHNNVDSFLDWVIDTRGWKKIDLEWYEKMMKSFLSNMTSEKIDFWQRKQIYIALWNIMTVCAEMKIDSCPIEWFIPEKYDEVLWLKDKWLSSVVILPIWYRDKTDKYSESKKVRFKTEDVIEVI